MTRSNNQTDSQTDNRSDNQTDKRRLVVCIDGTSNQFGTTNTNVIEFYSHVEKSKNQLTYYDSGVGTYAKSLKRHANFLNNSFELAFATNVHKGVLKAYRWLSDNYIENDDIFLFGFSRGAYQVRVLAAMIERVGLILPGNNAQIPFAYELYSRSLREKNVKEGDKTEIFKKTFSREPKVFFVGVWDTVSSVRWSWSPLLPLINTCNHIEIFRHALALDEHRVKFLPECVMTKNEDFSKATVNGLLRVKEVWFAGCHADVGGGNRRNMSLQSGDIPLLWMRNEAAMAGLKLKPHDVLWKISDLDRLPTESMRRLWNILELLPFTLPSYDESGYTTGKSRRWHLWRPRVITPGQKIHVSVLFKGKEYIHKYGKPIHSAHPRCPISFPRPGKDFMLWHDPDIHKYVDEQKPEQWERDIFDGAIAKVVMSQRDESLHLDLIDWLALLASSEPDSLSACEGLVDLVKDVFKDTKADNGTRISATVTLLRLAPNLANSIQVNSCVEMSVQAIERKKAKSYPEDAKRAEDAERAEDKRAEDVKRALGALALFADRKDALCDEINHYCLPAVVDLCSNPVTNDKDKRIQELGLRTLSCLLRQSWAQSAFWELPHNKTILGILSRSVASDDEHLGWAVVEALEAVSCHEDPNKDVASLKECATSLVSTLQSLPDVESAMWKPKASEVTDTNPRSLKIHRIIYSLCSLAKSHQDVRSSIQNSSLLNMLVNGVKRRVPRGTSHEDMDALLRGIFTVVHRVGMPKSIAIRFREKTRSGFFSLIKDEGCMRVCAAILSLASSNDRVVSTQVKKLIPSFPPSKHSSRTLAVHEAQAFLAFSACPEFEPAVRGRIKELVEALDPKMLDSSFKAVVLLAEYGLVKKEMLSEFVVRLKTIGKSRPNLKKTVKDLENHFIGGGKKLSQYFDDLEKQLWLRSAGPV